MVGADIASHEGFSYSDALAGVEGEWTYEKLDAWLSGPSKFAPGNKMSFAGVRDIATRAEIIKFLMSNTENPPPVPEPQAAEEESPAEEEAPAEDAAAPAEDEPQAVGEDSSAESEPQAEAIPAESNSEDAATEMVDEPNAEDAEAEPTPEDAATAE